VRIDKRDERGRTIDVHALCHTFDTLLSKGGVSPRTAQAAMRHSKIDLTMNVYTDPKPTGRCGRDEIAAGTPSCGWKPSGSKRPKCNRDRRFRTGESISVVFSSVSRTRRVRRLGTRRVPDTFHATVIDSPVLTNFAACTNACTNYRPNRSIAVNRGQDCKFGPRNGQHQTRCRKCLSGQKKRPADNSSQRVSDVRETGLEPARPCGH